MFGFKNDEKLTEEIKELKRINENLMDIINEKNQKIKSYVQKIEHIENMHESEMAQNVFHIEGQTSELEANLKTLKSHRNKLIKISLLNSKLLNINSKLNKRVFDLELKNKAIKERVEILLERSKVNGSN